MAHDDIYLSPGAPGAGMVYLPGAAERRAVWNPDDHLVEPETRQEIVRGERVEAQPSLAPHGDHHCQLDYVVRGKIAPGYVSSSDLLTRRSQDSDFATDTCVRKQGINPATGYRYLEEVTFEVVHTQRRAEMTRRAQDVVGSGVRRMFAIFVREIGPNGETDAQVHEWSPALNDWTFLPPDSVIADPCFAEPLPVKALIDAAEADNAVARALAAKGNPVIEQIKGESRKEGKKEGQQEALRELLLALLAHQGAALDTAQRARIEACTDAATLRRWFQEALASKLSL